MIAFIRGEVADVTENGIVLETGNIGYEIFMPSSEPVKRLQRGEDVLVYTYLHVREDAMQLFGFLSKNDLRIFRLLLGVNGIGPKAALGILSGMTSDALQFAVLSGDVKTLAKAPGVGRKTAQKLILELKDKFSLEEAFEQSLERTWGDKETKESGRDSAGQRRARQEAIEALEALGYSGTDALRAVRGVAIEGEMSVEAILKAALRNL
ncbi:MAG: Holliday junction branch migration protein RuvA [Eubacteriales bacterium]|nr:Holliday junction branch migration protein RuvA [Eubacteriales bacterium]